MKIETKDIIRLRKITGAGVSDCSEALKNSKGNLEKAVEYLRKKGTVKAAKKRERKTEEGVIAIAISKDSKQGTIVEVYCESDFVSKNSEFIQFVQNIANAGLEKSPEEEFNSRKSEIILKIGENITFGKSEKLHGEFISSYVHPNKKIGCLVSFNAPVQAVIAHDIAMHIAAANPLYLSKNDVPKDASEKEIEIYKEALRKEKKPQALLEKIALSKLEKFYQDMCLLCQPFIKDESVRVEKYLKEKEGDKAITGFVRFSIVS